MRYFLIALALLIAPPAHAAHRHARVWTDGQIVAHPAGCPRSAFCGCGASVEVFGHPVRSLYLASNWYRFPRTSPHAGAAVVWSHHVAVIRVAHGDGTATVFDANSGGHQTRIHEISLTGAAIVEPR